MPLFSAASTRISGQPGVGTYLSFILQNDAGSGVVVKPRRGVFQRDCGLTAYTSIMPSVKAYRGTSQVVEGALLLDKCPWDSTATASKNQVKVYSAYSPDLSNNHPLAGTPSGGMIRRSYAPRNHTLVEQVQSDDGEMMFAMFQSKDFMLYPGQAYLVQVDNSAAGTDPITMAWFYQVVWEEVALTTYAISGTVTNGGTGVVGAEVVVIVADDTSMTNAYLQEVVVTGGGGAWAANIPDGKIAYCYAQNYTGGIYYTAAGAPFIS